MGAKRKTVHCPVEVKAELNNRTIVLSVQFGGQGMLVKTNL
jgi:beta-lactamase superfamily II metal-dependent hydrolase